MAVPTRRPQVIGWLYTHNPFYAISAALMLFAVRNAYGELKIGTINCWLMMGALATYTSLLAAIGLAIVRWGKVWEDARSLLVVLILMFLAVSISADDLFADMASSTGGALLLLVGYVFSAVVSEVVLRGAGIRLGLPYRLPYHLMLLLFYVAPWWCSPGLHERTDAALEWSIFLFPVVAAGLLLLLLPAVRRGPDYVASNGTPWTWPWFPWTAFGFIVVAIALRTFALCMTFGPTGPIWIRFSDGSRAISFDTMWGPYFLIAPAFAVLLLVLEGGLVTGNRRSVDRALWCAPLLLLFSVPISDGLVFRGFLDRFTGTVGSPVWLAVWLQVAFFGWAFVRGVSQAGAGALAAVLILSVIGPKTLGFSTLTAPQAWPFVVVGAILLLSGIRRPSSRTWTLAGIVLAAALWIILPETPLARFRMSVCYHFLWGVVVALGLAFHDDFARILRVVGAAQMPFASIIALTSEATADVPLAWKISYVLLLAGACLAIALASRSRWYLYAFTSLLAIDGYGIVVFGFRGAVAVLGRAAMTSFAWGVAALITAFLISAHKARWLPPRLFPRWTNGGSPPQEGVDSSSGWIG